MLCHRLHDSFASRKTVQRLGLHACHGSGGGDILCHKLAGKFPHQPTLGVQIEQKRFSRNGRILQLGVSQLLNKDVCSDGAVCPRYEASRMDS